MLGILIALLAIFFAYDPMPLDTSSFSFTLSDGRTLGYRDIGPPDAFPIIIYSALFSCSSSLNICNITEDTLKEWGVRFILPDREGYGRTSVSTGPPSHRRFIKDVKELLNHLKIDKYVSVGFSTGGAYAMADAAESNEDRRLMATAIFGADPPLTSTDHECLPENTAKNYDSIVNNTLVTSLALHTLKWYTFISGNYSAVIDFFNLTVTPEELKYHQELNNLFQPFAECSPFSLVSVKRDIIAKFNWDFSLSDVRSELPIFIYHGGLDVDNPYPCVVNKYKKHLPWAKVTVWDCTHMGMSQQKYFKEISLTLKNNFSNK